MASRKSRSTVKASLATATVLQQSVEKSLALESENSRLRHHVSVLSRRLHEVIVELRKRDKITAAVCLMCGANHNQVDCNFWQRRVEEDRMRMEGTDFGGVVDVAPLVVDEEKDEGVGEKKIVVRLPVAVAESVAGSVVAEDVAMVDEAKGKEVAVVAEERDCGVGSREEDWTVVRRKVRMREEERKRKEFEERDAVRKRMNVWRPRREVVPNAPLGPRGMRSVSVGDSGYGSPGPSGGVVVKEEGVERVGRSAPLTQLDAPRGPAAYRGVILGSERRGPFGSLRPEEGLGWTGLVTKRGMRRNVGPMDERRVTHVQRQNFENGTWRGIPTFRNRFG